MPTAPPTTRLNFHDILAQRGLIAQCTDEALRDRFEPDAGHGPITAYCGFDPTADSLHVGSLVPMMALAWLQRCGHRPVVLVGGATGLVGDPSGKTEARKMLTREQIDHNVRGIAEQIGKVVKFDPENSRLRLSTLDDDHAKPQAAILLNNADWLAEKGWIEILREVGPHFSINRMLSMESVKGRLDAGGMSFLEFNYMVMQAYDFLHLNRTLGCTLQLGGQDQWGNIVMGIELIRRLGEHASAGGGIGKNAKPQAADAKPQVAGLTLPLVTKADGGKFGKSESGNIWLDPARTSPYDFYQFWRNVADADVERYLGYFTFLPMDEVRRLGALEGQAINTAKETLAYEVTKLIHGQAEADKALDSARKAFGAASDVTGEAIPHASIRAAELEAGVSLIELMTRAELAQSNGEARRLIQGGGVRLHDERITDIARQVALNDVHDGHILLRAGKKRLFRYDVG